jgi:beta-glucanase (GH16 family)
MATLSPDNTWITAGGTIWDAMGRAWTLVAADVGLGVAVNGVWDAGSDNIVLLGWYGGQLYSENFVGNWYTKPPALATPWTSTTVTCQVSAAAFAASAASYAAQRHDLAASVAALAAQLTATHVPSPGGVHAASPDNTYITAGGTIWDAAGHAWTIVSGVCTRDGVPDNASLNVIAMLWWGGGLYHVNSVGNWVVLASFGIWTPVTDPRAVVTPGGTPLFVDNFTSRNITTTGAAQGAIVVLAGSGGSITDSGGAVWTIGSDNTILRNGAPAGYTANATKLAYVSNTIWHANSDVPPSWYSWTGTTWTTGTGDPTAGSGPGTWMDHYPFGGSEYTRASEAQYCGSNVAGRTPGFDPFSVDNGILTITADTVGHTVTNPLGLPYNSGAITCATETGGVPTDGLFAQKYGYFVIRCLLPAGRGFFPGFWVVPSGRSGNPEIDILQALGHDRTHIYQAIHYDASDNATYTILNPATCATYGSRGLTVTVSDYSANWHTYGADVQADFITFYVDGVAQAKFPTPAAHNTTLYPLIDLAVGGAGSWPGQPDGSTVFPGNMRIDYIAAYSNFQASTGVAPPPPISGVPTAATAAGFNTQTFGQTMALGSDLRKFDFFGVNPNAITVSQPGGSGSITITGGGNNYGAQLCTASYASGATPYIYGVAFGGGGYFEASLSMASQPSNAGASFWANDVESMAGGSAGDLTLRHWPGQAADYGEWIEVDAPEFNTGTTNTYGQGMHNWFGVGSSPGDVNTGASLWAPFSPVTVPAGTDFRQSHLYGFLWVPATSTTQGYMEWYFDRVKIGKRISWDLYNPALAPPPVAGSSAFSVLDTRHLALIVGNGTPANPVTLSNLQVWQSSAAKNLPRATSGFTISGPVSTPTNGTLLNVNLTSQTGLSVDQSLFGVASSANNQTYADTFADPGWVSTMATLDIRGWRQQGENMMASMFPSAGSASGANFSGPISIFAAHVRTAFPNADLMWTCVDPGMLPAYQTSDPNVFASQVTQLATYLESQGVHIKYWDCLNEPEANTSSAQGRALSAAAFTALAAMNKGYQFGTCPTGPMGVIVAPWPSDCIAGYPNMTYIAGHFYGGATDSGSNARDLSWGSDWNGSTAFGPMGTSGSGITISNETVNGKKYPFALSEYGFSYGGGGYTNAASTNMIASCGYAVMLIEGALSARIWASHVWDAGQHVYGFASSIGGVAPHVFMLSHGGRKMPGNIVTANLVSGAYSGSGVGSGGGGPYLKVLATTGGLMVVNAGPTGSASGSIALGGLLDTNLTKWQQVATDSGGGFANNQGTTTTVSVGTGGVLAAQSFPPLSVTIYSGSGSGSPPPPPPPPPPSGNFTFHDDFTSAPWLTHRTWQAGDLWSFCATSTPDGRGKADGENGDQYWINPNNPNTPVPNLYRMSGGHLQLGLMVTPAGAVSNYIASLGGGAQPFVGCLVNNQFAHLQKYGRWSVTVAVPKIIGMGFQACCEDYPAVQWWTGEADFDIFTSSDGLQHVTFRVSDTVAYYTIFDVTNIDATVSHKYEWEWRADFVTFYIDGVQRAQVATPNWNNPMLSYMLTGANYGAGGDYLAVDPNPASLPAYVTLYDFSVSA